MYAARSVGESRSRMSSTATSRASLRSAPRCGSALVSTGSGSHGPMYVSRRTRADWVALIASLVMAVARYAAGFATLLRSVVCQRSHTSWTRSSASATLPSIRYAIPNRRGRTSANTAAACSKSADVIL
jgi:hypothetical protein